MNDKTTDIPKPISPGVTALELKGFAEGVQALVKHMQDGAAEDATKDAQAAAEQAARALLRNASSAVRMIRRLENHADEMLTQAAQRRTELMASMFGPDEE